MLVRASRQVPVQAAILMVFDSIRLIVRTLLIIPGILFLMIATPLVLLWWAVYLGIGSLIATAILGILQYTLGWPRNIPPVTLGDWLLNITVVGSAWTVATLIHSISQVVSEVSLICASPTYGDPSKLVPATV